MGSFQGVEVAEAVSLSVVRTWCASGEARRIRQRRGLSLGDVAAVIGSSPAVVARWETGAARPRRDAALRYSSLLTELDALGTENQDALP
jgi:DNA-binding transcriptional regulator YiaG